MSARIAATLCALLLSSLAVAACTEMAAASGAGGFDASEWDSDGWLGAIIGPEILARGDEFGCHGIPGLDPRVDHSAFEKCAAYLGSHSNASRWGIAPLSFGLDGGALDAATSAAAHEAGFRMVGPAVELGPASLLTSVAEDGGSLERNVADTAVMAAAIEAARGGGLVTISWQGRIGDLNVRKDAEAIEWLEEQPVWFTTWGEWWSHSEASRRIAAIDGGSGKGREVDLAHSDAPEGAWSTPGTVRVEATTYGVEVIDVRWDDGTSLPSLGDGELHLRVGWRSLGNGSAVITTPPGSSFRVVFSGDSGLTLSPAAFNGHGAAVSVAGLHTTDLMEWSSGFSDSPLRFTWLVEPGEKEGLDFRLLALAGVTLVATVATMLHLVRRDAGFQPPDDVPDPPGIDPPITATDHDEAPPSVEGHDSRNVEAE